MLFYQRLGDVPRRRYVQFRDNGTLLTEEVMGTYWNSLYANADVEFDAGLTSHL